VPDQRAAPDSLGLGVDGRDDSEVLIGAQISVVRVLNR
jgi:hypothetical protein